MSEIRRVSTGTPWEEQVGFCRVLRCDNFVLTAGTVAADDAGVIHGADCYEQCCYIFEKLQRAMMEVGCGLQHVVKTVCYITRLEDADGFTRAHKQYLGAAQPVCSCVQVAGLFGGALAEIELVALIPESM